MKRRLIAAYSVVLVGMSVALASAAEGPSVEEQLKKLDAAIASSPDNPRGYCEKARCLVKAGRYEEGYAAARKALQVAAEHKAPLQRFTLEEIELDNGRVEVFFNTGPDERAPREIGISRPLSFRVYDPGAAGRLREIIDFEIARVDGKPVSGALGQMQRDAHANFGFVDPGASYETIRAKALELIQARIASRPVERSDTKKYLNLELPGNTEFTPLVLVATPEKTIVARVAHVDGRRDVQVMQRAGDEWDFVGKRGRALTGADGTFLIDAKRGPDGRLWVVTAHAWMAQPEKRDGTFLYCYDDGAWRAVDAPKGHRGAGFAERGLLFIGSDEPAHHQLRFGERSGEVVPGLLQWHDGAWQPHPAEKILRDKGGDLACNEREAWVVDAEFVDAKTVLEGYRFRGPEVKDAAGPFRLAEIDGQYVVYNVALSDDGKRLAVLMKERAKDKNDDTLKKPYVGRIIDVADPTKPVVRDFPGPPTSYADSLLWSPKGELLYTDNHISTFEIRALRDGEWKELAKVTQDRAAGFIHGPSVRFRGDGEPIVTWEDFRPM